MTDKELDLLEWRLRIPKGSSLFCNTEYIERTLIDAADAIQFLRLKSGAKTEEPLVIID